jgi:hypothetical protein
VLHWIVVEALSASRRNPTTHTGARTFRR